MGGTAFFSLHVPLAFFGVDVVTGGCCCCCCCWSCFRSALLGSGNDGDAAFVGVGVIGLPSLISSTIWSASFDKSPSGLKGLSHPSELKQPHRLLYCISQKKTHVYIIPHTRRGYKWVGGWLGGHTSYGDPTRNFQNSVFILFNYIV